MDFLVLCKLVIRLYIIFIIELVPFGIYNSVIFIGAR